MDFKKLKATYMKKRKTMTDEEAQKVLRPAFLEFFRNPDFYPIPVLRVDGQEKNACVECMSKHGAKSIEGIRKIPRGQTVACDFCGKQIPEPPIQSPEN